MLSYCFANRKEVIALDYISIGGVEIKKTAGLAPMASVADRSYRQLCREFGASMVYSEMVSAKGIVFGDRKTAQLCTATACERPFSLQLFASEPDILAEAIRRTECFEPDFFDINMGCPVPKVAGNGCGCSLMKDPVLAGRLVRAAADATSRPVTVKIRAGWDDAHRNAVEFARRMEANGAAAIAVHGRTKLQMYSGKADREIIASVKSAVGVPVFGNGDVDSVESCRDMYERTGCDMVLIGRGSYGNPFLFRQIENASENHSSATQDFQNIDETFDVMLRHIEMIVSDKGELQGMREARRIAAWYIKGFYGAASFRGKCHEMTVYDDALKLADEYRDFLKKHEYGVL